MITMKKLIFSVIVLAAATFSAYAAGPSATTTADAKIKVVTPLTLVKTVDLNFGSIAVGSAAATATLTPAATTNASISGDGTLLTSSETRTAALFTATGQASSNFAITVDQTVSVAADGFTATAMTLTTSCSETGSAGAYTSALETGASKTFYIGGSLAIAGGQTAGSYKGTINVTVNYN
jgi:Mat/Ecp fimbriae major subunit